MAWPCISRVCCLSRFWNQFDKSDLSVPLTIQNYSEISEEEVRSITKQVPADRALASDASGLDHRGSQAVQDPGNGRRVEPGFKPREDYHPSGVPFPGVTQYKQDFKPWPIPKKDNFPWVGDVGGIRAFQNNNPSNHEPNPNQLIAEREERAELQRGQQPADVAKTSSYRQEYQPWTGVRPSKSAWKKPAYMYPDSEIASETSYRAAYSGDVFRHMETLQVDYAQKTALPANGDPHAGLKSEASYPHHILLYH
ncbi:microtubule-associated protein 6-like [Megalops cyprinoides]|uniref:microtubule-associated protein 6-like n=1 Tax=Megalops cyprinoides TaxID=118141 RepID=UPI0018650805|nr:microtubule-associated protein 6-like [Megalops cyprinoides]